MSKPSRNLRDLVFFLGGQDLEMVTIKDLLEQTVPGQVRDRGLAWGAKASDYAEDIRETREAGRTPVLVELTLDLPMEEPEAVIVDHHGPRAGANEPTALHQVFALLDRPQTEWTRWFELVAVNDRGAIEALLEAGATAEEIARVRAADRKAQGITPMEETQGRQAAQRAETRLGGRLTVVTLPHARTATVTDALAPALGGPGYENLLIYSPQSVHFFGQGPAILKLDQHYPGGWYGGRLPATGFWGHPQTPPDIEHTLQELLK